MSRSIFSSLNKKRDNDKRGVERLPADVYYVHSAEDDTVLIGMDVEIVRGDDGILAHWLDTVKERRMLALATETRGDVFVFTRVEKEGGGRYSFTPMSLEIYNLSVKEKLKNGLEFDNLGMLNAAFLSTREV